MGADDVVGAIRCAGHARGDASRYGRSGAYCAGRWRGRDREVGSDPGLRRAVRVSGAGAYWACATRLSRRARPVRCTTSPGRPAERSRRGLTAGSAQSELFGALVDGADRSSSATAPHRGHRGRALGRRGDTRPGGVPRAADRTAARDARSSRIGTTRSDRSIRSARRWRSCRGRSCGRYRCDRCPGVCRRAGRERRARPRRPVRAQRRQPAAADGVTRRGRPRHSGHRAGPHPGPASSALTASPRRRATGLGRCRRARTSPCSAVWRSR